MADDFAARYAGLLAGSLTQSAILGSAGDAIARLDRGPEVKRLLSDNVSVAYTVTYLFGTAGGAWFLSRVGPRLLGVDLAAACAALGRGSGEDGEAVPCEIPARGPFLIRAFRAQGPPWAMATVEMRTSAPITMTPEVWSMITLAGWSGSTLTCSISVSSAITPPG